MTQFLKTSSLSLFFVVALGCKEPQRTSLETYPPIAGRAHSPATSAEDLEPPTQNELDQGALDQDLLDQDLLDQDQPASFQARPRPPATDELSAPNTWLWARGLIHMHSVYSHDACDGDPQPDGMPNAPCLSDLRNAICASRLDFMLLTDHPETFADVSFTEATLHQASAGDQLLLDEEGQVIGNHLRCEGERRALIAPGSEGALMPVLLTRPPTERGWYRQRTPEAVEGLKGAGALVLHAHTEERSFEELWPLGLDGFEIYNLHANVNPSGPQLSEVF